MLYIQTDIKNIDYTSLLQHALGFCDVLTLQIPNNNKMIINKNNNKLYPELEIGHYEIIEDLLFEVYYDNANRLVERLFGNHIIKTILDTKYLTSIYGSERKIYLIKMSQEVVDNLRFTYSLFAWKFPFLPEDICLFSEDKCWLHSIAHEEICWGYDNSKDIKSILKKMKIKFFEEQDLDTIMLNEFEY